MKERYLLPQVRLIPMDVPVTPICASGEDYEIEYGGFDPGSDLGIY